LWKAHAAPQRIYNIAGGVHSIRQVLEIAQRLKPESQVVFHPGGKRLSPYPAAYDDTPARQELGWQPAYSIEAAVKEHLEIVASRMSARKR
jgi:nucleoside-diphosphate-sugar epimerase